MADGAIVAESLEAGLEAGRYAAAEAGVDEIMVIGGDDVFQRVMPLAGRIYLTEVHASPEADVWLRDFDLGAWREISRERHEAGPKDDHPSASCCSSGSPHPHRLRRALSPVSKGGLMVRDARPSGRSSPRG